MVIITYCLAVFAFCIAFYFTRPLATCSQIFVIVNQAVKTIANKNIDDATKETKLFEKIFAVEGEKHDAWYERRMYHIMSSSSSCIIAILMGMGLIVI